MFRKNIELIFKDDISYQVISIIAWGVILGVMEILFSDLLANYRLPYRGIIITLYMVIALIIAKFYNPQKFSLIYVVLIIVLMKGFWYQSVTHPALYAVIVEGIIAEAIYLVFGIKFSTSLIVGFGLMLYTFLHGWIMHGYFLGSHIFNMYKFIFKELFPWLNITNDNITILMIIAAIVHLILGIIAGFIGWYLVVKIEDIR